MNTYTSRILSAILAISTILMVFSIAYHFVNKEYVTETAVAYTAEDSVSFQGIYVRNESVISFDGSGVVNYCVEDGGKLGIGSKIAEIYQSDSDILINQQIKTLQHRKELLEKIKNPGTADVAQPSAISDLIAEKYKSTVYSLEAKNLDSIQNDKEELLVLLSSMQMITGDSDAFVTSINNSIANIDSQIIQLQSSQNPPLNTITADRAAYFVSYSDGLEETLTKENIENITADYIKSFSSDTTKSSSENHVIGKLIDSYQWYIVGIIDNSKNKYAETNYVTLKFESGAKPVIASIYKIKPTDNPNESIVILSCDELNYDLVQNRSERVDMIKGTYEGIKIPRKAIRLKELPTDDASETSGISETVANEQSSSQNLTIQNYRGVYVKLGEQVLFKKLDVIFEGDDFVISSKNSNDEYVQLYDDIIVDGVDADGN